MHVTIPTNLDVDEHARESFRAFYTALFDRTIARNARAWLVGLARRRSAR